ncbi:MAG: hypothetical protein ACPLKP_02780 [Microgenomates group bacterium]
MKKIVFLIFFNLFLIVSFFLFPKNVLAEAGNDCRKIGGECRPAGVNCPSDKPIDVGKKDCPPTRGGPTKCCIPTYRQLVACNGEDQEGIQTALGCIPIKPNGFVVWFLKFAIGIGGGIGFLLIIFGAIKILTSAGNPENVKAGQEMITSALSGLLFILFSIFLLELIGVKILNIPGFGTP